MTQKEKQLLLIDLCARLPHGVKTSNAHGILQLSPRTDVIYIVDNGHIPYLRPLSSMTEEEKTLMAAICLKNAIGNVEVAVSELSDFYNSRHFDYRGLIPMGLALEAPKEMYKTE